MSKPRQSVIVSRIYEREADDCLKAVELLLKPVKSKKGGTPIAAPDNPERSSCDIRANPSIPTTLRAPGRQP
jgi:hypothetical protein